MRQSLHGKAPGGRFLLLLAVIAGWAAWFFYGGYSVVLVWSRIDGKAVFPLIESLALTVAWLGIGVGLFLLNRRWGRTWTRSGDGHVGADPERRDDRGVKVLAEREKSQPPPPSIIWETLTDPYRPSARQWLVIADDEVQPSVVEAERPSLVVWSSLWPDRPNDVIRFTIKGDADGSSLKWSLESPDDPPDDARVRQLRHRINYLINGEMRDAFDC